MLIGEFDLVDACRRYSRPDDIFLSGLISGLSDSIDVVQEAQFDHLTLSQAKRNSMSVMQFIRQFLKYGIILVLYGRHDFQ